jgi:predicted RNase H-related nuclease YkuK (DUF458 family)
MKVFKKISGEKVNVVEHTLLQLKKAPTITIHIGTDSQNIAEHTIYSTVIAYRFGNRGVHYIYHTQKIKRINDIWEKLWKEAELSIETAEWLTQQINVNIEIDMDYNDNKDYKSNKLISAAKGWANSLGYKVNVKPNNQIATRAADYQCR